MYSAWAKTLLSARDTVIKNLGDEKAGDVVEVAMALLFLRDRWPALHPMVQVDFPVRVWRSIESSLRQYIPEETPWSNSLSTSPSKRWPEKVDTFDAFNNGVELESHTHVGPDSSVAPLTKSVEDFVTCSKCSLSVSCTITWGEQEEYVFSPCANIEAEADGSILCVVCWTRLPRNPCLLYTSPSPRDLSTSRMPSSA